jgi:hypothetical protein
MVRKMLSYAVVIVVTIVLAEVYHPLAAVNTMAQDGCQTYPETGKTVCGKFLTYWQQHGGLAQQGYPISSQFQEVSDLNGGTYTVQYFERAVFELHPEFAGTPNEVLLSQLGTFQFKRKYPNGEAAGAATPTPTTKIYDFGEQIPLAPGVTLESASVKIERTVSTSDPHLFWLLEVHNKSASDFPLQLPIADISIRDDLGNNFRIERSSGPLSAVAKPDNPFATEIWIFTEDQQIFDTVHYFDLKIQGISGVRGPFTFRWHIQR